MYKILFVCTGNICRSPTAHVVCRHVILEKGLGNKVSCDSAGTHGYHIGDPPDLRSQQCAAKKGYDLSQLQARKLAVSDFKDFDCLLAMDEGHYDAMMSACPDEYKDKIHMFADFADQYDYVDVPDPYYGTASGFDHVLDLVEDAIAGIINHAQDFSRRSQ